jgi:hypothetical protein
MGELPAPVRGRPARAASSRKESISGTGHDGGKEPPVLVGVSASALSVVQRVGRKGSSTSCTTPHKLGRPTCTTCNLDCPKSCGPSWRASRRARGIRSSHPGARTSSRARWWCKRGGHPSPSKRPRWLQEGVAFLEATGHLGPRARSARGSPIPLVCSPQSWQSSRCESGQE